MLRIIILLILLLYANTFRKYYNKLSSLPSLKLKSIDWLEVISRSNDIIINIKKLKDVKIDFTAGASSISLPSDDRIIESYNEIMIFGNNTSVQQPPILVAHQLGKKVVRKLPSAALLGALVLISSELLQREINTKSYQLPPLLQEIANSTVFELDTKLEYLSALKWDLDPFLAAEIENLQTQPLEVIDRYIVKELLPRVDKELSPVLSNLITDPAKVKQITANIKDLLSLGSSLLLTEQASRNQNDINTKINKYTNKILQQVFEQVDVVGQYMEDSVKDWNKIINSMNQMVKTDSVLNLFPNSSTLSSFTSFKPYQLPTTIDKDNDDKNKKE